MIERERLELEEESRLHPRAARSGKSKGRLRPEDPCPWRTAFQLDGDRILHCKAFRRLGQKTQVFLAPEGDHYRTRLTHTLEVSQIAREISRLLRLNEDLTEAIALGHDLGHTPFGHMGEDVIDSLLPGGFHHNEQSLRVIDYIERIEEPSRGLNLSWEVREGILKHTGPELPETWEGRVVRLADRMAYLNHDIDDAVRAGIIEPGDLPHRGTALLGYSAGARLSVWVLDVVSTTAERGEVGQSREIAEATTHLRDFLYHHVYADQKVKSEEEKIRRMLTALYEYYCLHSCELPREEEEETPRRVVDYLAGMTDRFAMTEFTRLFVPSAWACD